MRRGLDASRARQGERVAVPGGRPHVYGVLDAELQPETLWQSWPIRAASASALLERH